MTTVPIAFAFDNNLAFPVSICLFSLLSNAKDDTFYDVFILHSGRVKLETQYIEKVALSFERCRVQYRPVPSVFDEAYEVRGITTPAYYRLLIPELIHEYDKVIYSDVDVVFRSDLSDLYKLDMSEDYLAATLSVGMNLTEAGKSYLSEMPDLIPGKYIQSGFIMMNVAKMRADAIVSTFKSMADRKLKFQDQDILNIVCKGRIRIVPPKYNMTNHSYEFFLYNRESALCYFSDKEIDEALTVGTVHFNGQKPWVDYCANFDQWWEYYRKSPVFDARFYFDFFNSKLNVLDKLSLGKRIKILARYFIIGKK